MKVNVYKKTILSLATASVILVGATGTILDKSNLPNDYKTESNNTNDSSKLNIRIIEDYDYSDISKEFTVQGYTLCNDSLFISAYHTDKQINSRVFIIDPILNTKKTIILDNQDHVGGISVDRENNILFISGSNGKISTYNLSKIYDKLSDNDLMIIRDDMVIPNDLKTYTNSVSSMCIKDNKIYTTTYGKQCILKEFDYELEDNKIKTTLNYTKKLDTPCVQGISIYNDHLVLSSSASLVNGIIKMPSKISIYNLNNFEVENISYIKQAGLEGIDIDNNGNISGIFELEDQKIKNIGKVKDILKNDYNPVYEHKFNYIYELFGNGWDNYMSKSNKTLKLKDK